MADRDGGLAGIVRLADFEPLARAALDPIAYDYIAGGSFEEVSLAENGAAWRRRRFRPRVLRPLPGRRLHDAPRVARKLPAGDRADGGPRTRTSRR